MIQKITVLKNKDVPHAVYKRHSLPTNDTTLPKKRRVPYNINSVLRDWTSMQDCTDAYVDLCATGGVRGTSQLLPDKMRRQMGSICPTQFSSATRISSPTISLSAFAIVLISTVDCSCL